MKSIKHRAYHTHAQPGKRVRVRLRDGTIFTDKFTEYPQGTTYEFEAHGKIKASLIEKVELYSKAREISRAIMRVNRTL
jgi:hypothetical protein